MERAFWKCFIATFIVLGFVVFTSGSVLAAGITVTEKGSKGLGNAWAGGAASAEDASTVYWNPAGLTRLEGLRAEASLHVIRPSFEFNDQGSSHILGGPLNGGSGGDAGGAHFIPNFFYSHSISDKLTAGIGVTVPFGLGTEYDAGWQGRYHGIKSEITNIDINPSIAYRISNQWSIGGGISAQYIDAELTQAIDYGTIDQLSFGGAFLLTPQGDDGTVKLTADDWSFGWNLGVLFELTENTRFGLAYRSEVSHDLKGDASYAYPNPAAATLATLANLVNGGASASIDLPANLGLSGYHRFGDWAVMANITWTEWSSLPELRIKFDTGAADSVTTLQWDDSLFYSIGASWYLNDQLTLRGGVAYDETPVPSAELRTPRVPDTDRIWVSGGGSYQLSDRWGFDFAATWIFADDPKINRSATALPEDALRGSLIGQYDAYSYILSAQINFLF